MRLSGSLDTPPLTFNWTTLGADAEVIASSGGQTFTDIGTTLGVSELAGVNVTLEYTFDGVGTNSFIINGGDQSGATSTTTGIEYLLFDGTLDVTFSNVVVEASLGNGGSFSPGEVNSFDSDGGGSLTSTHTQTGLVVTDDSVTNTAAGNITSNFPVWVGSGTTFSHTADVGGFLSTQGVVITSVTAVPEPSSAALLLGLSALGFLARRRR